jgi:hypothetical protein
MHGVLNFFPMAAILADMGLPMLFVTFPAMLFALIPVIFVEAFVLGRHLNRKMLPLLKPIGLANIFSTCIGIPVTWFVFVGIQIATGGTRAYGLDSLRDKFLAVTWQSPWLIPYDNDLWWMVPTAFLVLLIPFFFVSWISEYVITTLLLKDADPVMVRRGMFMSNLASYSILLLWIGYLFIRARR